MSVTGVFCGIMMAGFGFLSNVCRRAWIVFIAELLVRATAWGRSEVGGDL